MEGKTLRTICQLCHTNCGLIVHRDPGGEISIKGDPEHPMNRGRCCTKVLANSEILRAKDRLRYPMLREGGGFKRVSWDEALTFAAEKLGEIRKRFGPSSLVRFAGAPVSYQARDGFLEFMGAFGSPNLTGVGNLCMAPRMTAFKAVTGEMRAEPDYENANLVIFWGSNPVGSERFSSYEAVNGLHRILSRLKERGALTICIDPYRSETAGRVDQWVRIKPGTDVALGLAMIHAIIAEGLYDKSFVNEYTYGFEQLAAHVKNFDPRWAEGLTGIPAATIEGLAKTYAGANPAAIYEGNGLDMYANGVDAVRTIADSIALTGNLDVRGGNVFMPFPHPSPLPTKPASREQRLRFDEFPLLPQVPFTAVKEALLGDGEDRPRAMIVHHGNPVLIQANEKRTRRALENLDFLMVCDVFPTSTTEMADLVLPITSDFESRGYRAYSSVEGGILAMARPVAEPVGEARPVFEVEYELAEKMNLHHDYPFRDDRTWIDYMVRSVGVTYDRLDAEQIVQATPPVKYRKYKDKSFDTPSGKVEFYSKWFEKKGAGPLPVYTDPAGELLTAQTMAEKGFSLLGTSRRPAQFVHTKFKNLEQVAKFYPAPLIYLHPQDAADRGIAKGDQVEVESPQGCIRVKAEPTENTEPGLVWIDFGWGNPTDGEANINLLTNDEYYDPVSGGTPNRLFPCELRKC